MVGEQAGPNHAWDRSGGNLGWWMFEAYLRGSGEKWKKEMEYCLH